jgi:hypothetical protein
MKNETNQKAYQRRNNARKDKQSAMSNRWYNGWAANGFFR